MAFNPFSGFRKHRKTVFAILTIICMFVFIMSTGLGGGADPLNRAWFTGRSGPEIARLDGERITASELNEVRLRRLIANEYMRGLVLAAGEQLTNSLEARLNDFDPVARAPLSLIIREKKNAPQLYLQRLGQHLESLKFFANQLEQAKKTDQAELLRRFRRYLETEIQLLYRGDMFFAGGTKTAEELLDFMVWRLAARERGIELSREMVIDLIETETYGQSVEERSLVLQRDLSRRYNVSVNTIIEALTDEFQVRIAQTALLGVAPYLTDSTPAYVTPFEAYDFYRDQRTAVRVQLLPIPVEPLVADVKEEPTEAELKALFAKHQRDEWVPYLERPGFKEGRKAKVAFLGTKGDNPTIKKVALEQAEQESRFAEAVQKVLYAPILPDAAGILSRVGWLAITLNPKLIERRVDREYEEYLKREQSTSWVYSSLILFGVHDRSLYDPQPIASAIAAMLGQGGTLAPAIAPIPTWYGHAGMSELMERIRFGLLPFALAGPEARTLLGITDLMLPQPLSRAAMGDMLRQNVVEQVVRDYLNAETAKFQREVEEKGKNIKQPGVAEQLEKYIAEFANKHGMTRGQSQDFRDQYTMVDDPGSAPMRAAYFKDEQRAKSDPQGYSFASTFFTESNNPFLASFTASTPYRVVWFLDNQPTSSFAKPDDEYFLVWKTDEIPARVRKFEEARADVVRAWKLAKARELGRKRAEEWQQQIRDKEINTLAALRDFAAQKQISLVEVGPLARLNEHPPLDVNQPTQYFGPRIPPDKVNYPTEEMVNAIVDLRKKTIGETIIVSNAPKTIYYVAMLTDRIEPTDLAFQLAYARAGMTSVFAGGGDQLFQMLENERRGQLVRETMEQLRKDFRLQVDPEQVRLYNGNREES
ncbi:MAG: hypothetical protein N2039_02890 [Gemmataceae bacterium]|nr:hypothetical protein [Gemmataceae bacterium]